MNWRRRSDQTIQVMKIRILSRLLGLQTLLVAFTMLWAYQVQKKSSRLDGSKLFSKMEVSEVLADNYFYILF